MSSRRGAAVGVLLGLLGLNGALDGQQECTLGDDGPIRRGRRCSTAPLRPGFGKTAGGVASLAEGMSVAEIVKDFPTLDESGVRAVIAFATASAGDDLPISPAPSHA